jgi:hypothetical protein
MGEPEKKSKRSKEEELARIKEKKAILRDNFKKSFDLMKSLPKEAIDKLRPGIFSDITLLTIELATALDKSGKLLKFIEGKTKKETRQKDDGTAEEVSFVDINDVKTLQEFSKLIDEILSSKSLKKLPQKFTKLYSHPEIDNILHSLFKPGNIGFQGKFFSQDKTTEDDGLAIWENKGVEYHIKLDDLPKLQGKDPKVYVSQIKNINLLMLLSQEQNFNNSEKQATCDFTVSEYAERRGYSKAEIIRGGAFLEELKRDLLTGAYLTYRIDKIKIQGKNYIAHGIPNFYTLLEPTDSKIWKVIFNDPYKSWLMELLEGNARQYFIKDRKAIEDRITTEKPYLFLFYMQLTKRRQNNLLTKPVKIGNLLTDMKLPEHILARPKECFNIIKECLIYFSQNYKPDPLIESFKIYSDFHKTKAVKMPLSISEAFKNIEYQDFKDLLVDIGIKDLREAYVSFKRPVVKAKKSSKFNDEEQGLLDKTLKWFNDPYNPNRVSIPLKDQESLIRRYIKQLGQEQYKALFEKEANKFSPNSITFLTKTLKECGKPKPYETEDDKEEDEKTLRIKKQYEKLTKRPRYTRFENERTYTKEEQGLIDKKFFRED